MSQTAAFPQAYPAQFQPAYTQAASPGQQFPTQQMQPGPYYVQSGQPSQAMGQQAQPGRRPNRRRPTPPPTTAYWKSAFIADKLVEFFILLATWICIVRYSSGVFKADGRANFFKGITVFCWLMVILFEIAFVFVSSNAQRFFRRPKDFTIICLVVQIILTLLLIACTVNLVPLAHDSTKWYDFLNDAGKTNLITLYLALIFGFFACMCFLDDIRSLYKMIGTQSAEEQAAAVNTEQQQVQQVQQVPGAFAQSVPVEPVVDSQM